MPSRPDYIAAWLGITRVGGVVALINTRLVGLSLSHCINVADADHVILAGELEGVFETALPYLNRAPKIWIHGSPRQRRQVSTPRWIEWMAARCRRPSGAPSPSTTARC